MDYSFGYRPTPLSLHTMYGVLPLPPLSSPHQIAREHPSHVVRMSDDRLPKQLLYGELKEGKRTVGGQKKRYKDTLKSTLKELKISTDNWEGVASDRPAWRSAVRTGARSAESRRITAAQSKRAARKARAASSADLAPTVPCPTCGRFLRSRAGLAGHMRVHRPRQHSV